MYHDQQHSFQFFVLCSLLYPNVFSASGTILFIILKYPPPASFLNFTRAKIWFNPSCVTIHY